MPQMIEDGRDSVLANSADWRAMDAISGTRLLVEQPNHRFTRLFGQALHESLEQALVSLSNSCKGNTERA